MPKPPPLNVTASADAPLDRAMAFGASGDAEGAIRWAVPLVKADLSAVVPLFVLGQQLRVVDQTAAATLAFETAADRAADNGNLPMALASIAELRALGVDVSARTDSIAKIY